MTCWHCAEYQLIKIYKNPFHNFNYNLINHLYTIGNHGKPNFWNLHTCDLSLFKTKLRNFESYKKFTTNFTGY